jgi:hypothetical protein
LNGLFILGSISDFGELKKSFGGYGFSDEASKGPKPYGLRPPGFGLANLGSQADIH